MKIVARNSIVLVLAVMFANLTILGASRVELLWSALDQTALKLIILGTAWMVLSAMPKMTGRIEIVRLRLILLLSTLAFIVLSMINLRIFNHLTMFLASDRPFQDQSLADWDKWLGWDIHSYLSWVNAHPLILKLLDKCYDSLDVLVASAVTVLLLCGYDLQTKRFVQGFLYARIATVLLGWITPAIGSMAHYSFAPESLTNFSKPPGLWFLEKLYQLRQTTGQIFINPHRLPGLTAVPSLHTGAGVLLVFAFWSTRLLLPGLVYVVLMIAATPIFGGHYMVDVITGIILAATTHYFACRICPPTTSPEPPDPGAGVHPQTS